MPDSTDRANCNCCKLKLLLRFHISFSQMLCVCSSLIELSFPVGAAPGVRLLPVALGHMMHIHYLSTSTADIVRAVLSLNPHRAEGCVL